MGYNYNMTDYSGDKPINELLRLARTSQDARNELIQKTYDKLRRITSSVRSHRTCLGATTDDLHIALVKVMKRFEEGKEYENDVHYFASFKKTVTNILIDQFRKLHVPQKEIDDEDKPEGKKHREKREERLNTGFDPPNIDEPGPPTQAQQNEDKIKVLECAVEALTTKEFDIFFDIHVIDIPKKIAFTQRGIPEATGRGLLIRMREKIIICYDNTKASEND